MKIPCDTIARLSHLLGGADVELAMQCFRLDNGKVIVTNRKFMAVEEVDKFEGVFYIMAHQGMIEQCRTEAQFSSVIDFSPVPALQYTTAITSMGFKIAENIGYWPGGPVDFDKWRDMILKPCLDPLTESKAPMVFDVTLMHQLAQAAPTGRLVLEQYADPDNRATVVRDIDSPTWVGFFKAGMPDGRRPASATVPGWCK